MSPMEAVRNIFSAPGKILLIYLAAVNIAAFAVMGADKLKARRGSWRVPESTLFLLAVIGGSLGGILGIYVFRHKTLHRSFTIGFPVILVLQIALAVYIILSGR